MGGLDHLPERVCCGALSGGNSSSDNVKGGARNAAGGGTRKAVGGGAGKVFLSRSPDGGRVEFREGGGEPEDSGEPEGSGATKAGFRRSMEMT